MNSEQISYILNELSIISDRVSSLEELTELRILADEPILCDIDCIGDMMGQCSTSCNGLEPMGIAHFIVAQCGRPANLCRSCSPAMHEAMSMPAVKPGELACKYEWVENDRLPPLDAILAAVRTDYTSTNSNKPRRARVDNDDLSIADGVVSGLGGSTERRDSEQKPNMHTHRSYRAWMASDEAFEAELQRMYADDEPEHGKPIADLHRWSRPAIVYCCNGAMYEARQ